jgi:hypothetical protein
LRRNNTLLSDPGAKEVLGLFSELYRDVGRFNQLVKELKALAGWEKEEEQQTAHSCGLCGGRFLVYCNPVENTVFCDWDWLVGGVELPTLTQHLEETPPETPPMPEQF